MARTVRQTFNPNRVGGGGVSIVRDADGNYSLKEQALIKYHL